MGGGQASRVLLQDRLGAARAGFRQVCGPVALAALIRETAPEVILLQDHPWLRPVADLLGAGGLKVVVTPPGGSAEAGNPAATTVTVGVGAVPETGSLLVNAADPAAWRLSLCPRHHVILIPLGKSDFSMEEALAWSAAEPSGLVTWITGPSRTADIEKVLVLGAQGATEVLAVIYTPENSCPVQKENP